MRSYNLLALITITVVFGLFIYIEIFSQQKLKLTTSNAVSKGTTYVKKCYFGSLHDILLVLNFNFPFYDNILLLKDLYGGVFARIVTCGPPPPSYYNGIQPDIAFESEYGHLGYHCMALAIERYPNYKGYLFGNDDMIINWWNLVNQDKNRIWHGTKVVDWRQKANGEIVAKDWIWWKTRRGIKACQSYHDKLKSLTQSSNSSFNALFAFQTYLSNSQGSPRCGKGWADFFYIPRNFSKQYISLSKIAYSCGLFLEIAVHNTLRSLDLVENHTILDGLYLPDVGLVDYNAVEFWKWYTYRLAFIHPYKFHGPQRFTSLSMLKKKVMRYKEKLTRC